jgi:GTPase SAR1 family protein
VKVVIKGDKNTGKTCLWRRLQRMAFLEDYRSTEQIQIATIAWDYKGCSFRLILSLLRQPPPSSSLPLR